MLVSLLSGTKSIVWNALMKTRSVFGTSLDDPEKKRKDENEEEEIEHHEGFGKSRTRVGQKRVLLA